MNPYLRHTRRKPAKSEHCLQRAIVRWCRGAYGAGMVRERFAAIPNGWSVPNADAKSRAIQGAKLKAEGARAGMPDMVFWGPAGILWMEVKLGTQGRLSPAQLAVHESLMADGQRVVVVRNLGEAVEQVTSFYRK